MISILYKAILGVVRKCMLSELHT